MGDIFASQDHSAVLDWAQSGQGLGQFALPVAGNARQAQDFAGAHIQAEVL